VVKLRLKGATKVFDTAMLVVLIALIFVQLVACGVGTYEFFV
jgi:hypothetical protein